MKFIRRIQCSQNKHIYFINGSFTSFLIHLFLALGIDLFRGKNSSFTTSSGRVIPYTHWCEHGQNFDPVSWLKGCFPSPGFLRQGTICSVAKWTTYTEKARGSSRAQSPRQPGLGLSQEYGLHLLGMLCPSYWCLCQLQEKETRAGSFISTP